MGWFDSENKESKMYKALEGFEVHTSDITVKREIIMSEFIQHVHLNTYDGIREIVDRCKQNNYNGLVGLRMTQGAGLGGAAGVIIYGTAVMFK